MLCALAQAISIYIVSVQNSRSLWSLLTTKAIRLQRSRPNFLAKSMMMLRRFVPMYPMNCRLAGARLQKFIGTMTARTLTRQVKNWMVKNKEKLLFCWRLIPIEIMMQSQIAIKSMFGSKARGSESRKYFRPNFVIPAAVSTL